MTITRTPAPPPGAYVLTREELDAILRETVRMAAEYWMTGRHDTTEKAAVAAAFEMLGRLERERQP